MLPLFAILIAGNEAMLKGPAAFNVAASTAYKNISPSLRQTMVDEAVSTLKVLTSQDIKKKREKYIWMHSEASKYIYICSMSSNDVVIIICN